MARIRAAEIGAVPLAVGKEEEGMGVGVRGGEAEDDPAAEARGARIGR